MIVAFNSVYTALQSFLARSFWFANFLPVALFAVLHAIIALFVIGPINLWGSSLSFDAINLAAAGPAVILAVVAIAYLLAPLIPVVRGVLDGSQLPAMVHDYLRGSRLADAYEIKNAIYACEVDYGELRVMDGEAHANRGAVAIAFNAATMLRLSAPSEAALRTARQELDGLNRALFVSGLLLGRVKSAEAAILSLLRANSPHPEKVPPADRERAIQTNQACESFKDLLSKAATEAEYRLEIIQKRNRVLGALDNPMATMIGDARSVTQGYSLKTYGVDFDFLWPRLLAAIKAVNLKDPILDAIESSSAAVDFAVMSLMLAASLLLWLIVILCQGGPVWAFLVLGAAIPFVFGFFHTLVFEGQLAFGEVIKTAIDQHRFLVLNMLRQPEPKSRSEELRLWARIRATEQNGRTSDVVYVPTKSAGG
jgi:hypothetical protein